MLTLSVALISGPWFSARRRRPRRLWSRPRKTQPPRQQEVCRSRACRTRALLRGAAPSVARSAAPSVSLGFSLFACRGTPEDLVLSSCLDVSCLVLCRGGAAAGRAPGDRHRGAAGPAVPGKAKLSGKGERSAKGGYSAKAEYPAKGEQPGEGGHSAKAELPGEGARR